MQSSIVSANHVPFERIALAFAAICLFIPADHVVVLAIATAALLTFFVSRRRNRGVATIRGAINRPLIVYAGLLLPLSALMSPLSIEAVGRSVIVQWACIALFCTVADPPHSTNIRGRYSTRGLLILVAGIAGVCGLVGLLLMRQSVKFSFLQPVLLYLRSIGAASVAVSPGHVALLTAVSVPMATLAALDAWRHSHRRGSATGIGLLILPVLLAGVTLLAQSRSALIAIAAGLSIALWLAGRRGKIVLGGLIIAGVGLAAALGLDSILDAFLFAGKATGLSVATVFTSRTELWSRALFAMKDFPITGLGPDSFGTVMRLYPLREAMLPTHAYAHNQVLQLITESGVFAPLLLFWITLAAIHPLWRARATANYITAGILGSLVAFTVVCMGEAVPTGSWLQLLPWVILAMAVRVGGTVEEQGKGNGHRHPFVVPIVLCGLLLADFLLHGYSPLVGVFRDNVNMLRYARAVVSGVSPSAYDGPIAGEWLRGLAYHHRHNHSRRDASWRRVLVSDVRYVLLVRQAVPDNRALAEYALAAHPSASRACFWSASLRAVTDTVAAIDLYRRGLAIDANAALEWRKLGDLLAIRDPHGAIAAYLESCRRGDPGANGCLLAGKTAERIGEYEAALRYYRMSRWGGAHALADSLERRILRR